MQPLSVGTGILVGVARQSKGLCRSAGRLALLVYVLWTPAAQAQGAATVAERRAEVRAALAQGGQIPPARLVQHLADPDEDVRRLAVAAALALGWPAEAEPLLRAWFAAAPPHDVRFALEHAARPLPSAAAAFARELAERSDGGGLRLAADLAVLLAPPEAEQLIAELCDRGPLEAEVLGPRLLRLGQVGGRAAIQTLARALASSDPTAVRAARDACESLRVRLLAAADLEGADALLAACLRSAPGDLSFVLGRAEVAGLFLGRTDEALGWLADARALRAAAPAGSGSVELATIALGEAVLRHFAERDGADSALAAALDLLGSPPPSAREAAETRARLLLARAALALDSGGGAALVSELLREAAEVAPYDDETCLFDFALSGPLGPAIILDRLRRLGRSEVQIRFYEALAGALRTAPAAAPIGFELAAAEVGGDVGREQIRSWTALHHLYALLQAGRLDEAVALGEHAVRALQDTVPGNNRWLLAEIHLAVGRCHLLGLDAAAAERHLTAAAAVLDELGQATLHSIVQDQRGHLLPGAAPLRLPFGDRQAAALSLLSETKLVLGGDLAGAVKAARAANLAAPEDDLCLLAALRLAATPAEHATAARALASWPRTADAVRALAALAGSLGDGAERARLFAQHLEWNALTPASRAAEERLAAADPHLRGP